MVCQVYLAIHFEQVVFRRCAQRLGYDVVSKDIRHGLVSTSTQKLLQGRASTMSGMLFAASYGFSAFEELKLSSYQMQQAASPYCSYMVQLRVENLLSLRLDT